MTLSPQLLAILVCPKCKGALEYRETEPSLVCHTAGCATRCATTSRSCSSTRRHPL